MADWKAVNVSTRVRPLSTAESTNPDVQTSVTCLDTSVVIDQTVGSDRTRFFGSKNAAPRSHQFSFDNVFHPHCSQLEVYESTARPVVRNSFKGINGAVLAYGATGSGKTHSMFGNAGSAPGLVFQAMQDIFEEKRRLEMTNKYVTVKCAFFEVYNERVFDLLTKRSELQMRDPGDGGLEVVGLKFESPTSGDEFIDLVERGRMSRFTAATGSNAESSRSHAILALEVEVRDSQSSSAGLVSKIKMCDLAGSERAANTSNTGIRLKEGGNINKSLLALGGVVQALAVNSKGGRPAMVGKKKVMKEIFVPYRGSKLTRILRDCIGGNCSTSMLFCVSPASNVAEETLNTMHFAMQAKEIQVTAKRNEFKVDKDAAARSRDKIIEELRLENASLKDELYRLRCNGGVIGSVTPTADAAGAAAAAGATVAAASLGASAGACEDAVNDSLNVSASSIPRVRISTEIKYKDASVECNPVDCMLHQQEEAGESGAQLGEFFERLTSIKRQWETTNRRLEDFDTAKELALQRQVREETCKIANYYASIAASGASDQQAPPPVGVAGSQQLISRILQELSTLEPKRVELEEKLQALNAEAEQMRREMFRNNSGGNKHGGRQHVLEMAVDNLNNANLKLESEAFARQYYERSCSHEQRVAELDSALRRCLPIIRAALDQGRFSDSDRLTRGAVQAIAFAAIPSAETAQLLDSFKAALKEGQTNVGPYRPRQSVKQEFFEASNKCAETSLRQTGSAQQQRPVTAPKGIPPPSPTTASAAFSRTATTGSMVHGGSTKSRFNKAQQPAWNGGSSSRPSTKVGLSTPAHSFQRTLSMRKASLGGASVTTNASNKENAAFR